MNGSYVMSGDNASWLNASSYSSRSRNNVVQMQVWCSSIQNLFLLSVSVCLSVGGPNYVTRNTTHLYAYFFSLLAARAACATN